MAYRFPSKDEIEWAVRHINLKWAREPSWMRVYHLKMLLAAEHSEEISDPTRWWIAVEIIQLVFDIGELALDSTWNNVILLLKGGGEYCGIGLVGVIRKVIFTIIDRSLVESIELHDVLHMFIVWKGTRTATLRAKIFQEITGMQKEVLYEIFLIYKRLIMRWNGGMYWRYWKGKG